MLVNMTALQGLTVRARDGEIGHTEEFYFDDEKWTVRYVVVDTGGWMGHHVLLSPIAFTHTDLEHRTMDVALTRDRIRNSPGAESHRPVSRRYEEQYSRYYAYAPYWGGAGYWGAGTYPAALAGPPDARVADAQPVEHGDSADSHLRSSKEVTGYHILATDGEIGHVDDFIVDQESWVIRYLRLDTSNWIGGKSVLLPRQAVREVRWPARQIAVDLSKEDVWNSPEYDPARLGHEYEQQLGTYYGR